jgi:hypothetical protein
MASVVGMPTARSQRTALLATLGVGVVGIAFLLEEHPTALAHGGPLSAALLGGGLVLLVAAVFDLVLGRSKPVTRVVVEPRPAGPLTLHGLRIGRTYRMRRAVDDFYANHFAPDELLTFRELHVSPPDGGYTLVFAERGMFLQEERNRDVIDAFAEYLEPVRDDRRPAPVDPADHATVNAAIAALPSYMSDEVADDVAARHGTRVAVSTRRIVDDVISAPVDWRTATMDDGLLAMTRLADERYPWLDRPARARLSDMFTMTWK